VSGREYRIEYTIQAADGDDDWVDVGFGSSGKWDDVGSALYDIQSAIQNRQWETEPGMPDPKELETTQ
jgi:hypothetical protein